MRSRRRLVHETRQRNAELALINSVQAAIAGELDPQAIYDLVGDKLQEVFDAQVVSISVYDEPSGLLNFPYVIERGERLDEQPIQLIGFRKHVMETRKSLMIEESSPEVAERYGNPYVLSGEPIKSAFRPACRRRGSTGVISLQNVDRTHAFNEDDQRLLTTLAGSLSVALDNARLVHETRQRVAELATVNSVGQALATQLELDALIELVGERLRETFEADIAYVALHDEAAGRIEFVYYYESGERRPSLRSSTGRDYVADPAVARAAAAEPAAEFEGTAPSAPPRCRISACRSRRRQGDRRHQRAEHPARRDGSPSRRRGSWRRSPRTSGSRSRTRACSQRSSGNGSTSSRWSRSVRSRWSSWTPKSA